MNQQPESTFNQSAQTVIGPQTNIAGNQTVLEGGTKVRRPIDLEEALAQLAAMPSGHVPAPADLPGNSLIPYGWNEHFVGRQPELMALASALRSENSTAIVSGIVPDRSQQAVAATGIGGIGKTQLAAAFAHCYGQYFLGGVYWLSFANPAAIETEIARCAELMDDLPQWVNTLPLIERVPHIQRLWQEALPRLLIFDNCEDPALLAQYRPKTGGCRILVTSRRSRWSSAQGICSVGVGTLPPAESVELLRKFSPPADQLGWDDQQLAAVAEAVGHLPLALHLAGSYLRLVAPALTPTHYLQQLQRGDLLQHESFQEGELSPTEHELHVASTFAISFEQLQPDQTVDAAALKLLIRAALFAPGESIPLNLLYAAAGLADKEKLPLAAKARDRLLNLGLLEEDEARDPRLHRLLGEFVIGRMQDEITLAIDDVEMAALNLTDTQNKEGDPRPLLKWQVHLCHFTDKAQNRLDDKAARLCNELGYQFQMLGDYSKARHYYERAVFICEKVLSAQDPNLNICLSNLGSLLHSVGDYPNALLFHQKALAGRLERFGEWHEATAVSFNNLGVLLKSMGNFQKASEYLQQALQVRLKKLGEQHPDTAASMLNLGGLLQELGDYKSALSYVQRAETIFTQVLGNRHPKTAVCLNNEGDLLWKLGRYDEAHIKLEQSLAIRMQLFGEQHPDTLQALNNLGLLFQTQGNLEKSYDCYKKVLVVRLQTFGKDNPDTATSFNNVGAILQAMGDYNSARSNYEEALKIRVSKLGKYHHITAESLNNIGCLLHISGDLLGASSYYIQALEIRQKIFGERHPATAQSLNNLGSLFQDTGNLVQARLYYERTLAINREIFGERHPNTADSLNNLGIQAFCEGDKFAAANYLIQALAIYEEYLGSDHPKASQTRQDLQKLRSQIDNFDQTLD